MDMTDAQKARLRNISDTFGRRTVRAHARSRRDGHVRVDLQAQAGVWTWTINANGDVIDTQLTMKPFDMDPATASEHPS